MLSPKNRLKNSSDFDKVYKKGKHVRGKYGKFVFLNRDDGEPMRVGIIVPGKLGNAVQRNKAKRVIRGVVRKHMDYLPTGYDSSIILWTLDFETKDMEKEVSSFFKKLK